MRFLNRHYLMRLVRERLPVQRHRCPFNEGRYSPRLDYWEFRRWGFAPLRAISWWIHNGARYAFLQRISQWAHERQHYFIRNLFNVYGGGTRWPYGKQPRTCSYCGGVHPEDAIDLIARSGWSTECTDKYYKWYLEPPEGCVPPLKIYVSHFTGEQIQRFNNAITAKK